MNQWGPRQLAEAVVIWTGWGRSAWPLREDSLVVDHFGSDLAAELMPTIHALERDFYSSDARYLVADLAEMAEVAADQFRTKHPELTEETVRALAWCYSYDYK